jgi:TetR/AcrR family transcriptional regulator, regulator of cefoperazone and chloramphenicol sensitivity
MRNPRIDGEESRQRLLHAAVNCFAAHGFAKTSTRMIATEADTNIAAISYYFGDKAGLYRAAFTEPMGSPQDDIALFNDPKMSLDEALRGLYSGFIAPLKENAHVQQCIRLHMREMVEPTGLWAEEISQGCKPHQDALVKLLVRHYDAKKPDDDIVRLAISIVALGVHMFVGRDLALQLYPRLISGHKALDVMHERLVMYARAMVDAEGARRKMANMSIALPKPQRALKKLR